MGKFTFESIILLVFLALGVAQVNGATVGGITTVYLVRHTEKVLDDSHNPPLTECGKQRAGELAKIFSSIPFDKIYSTDFVRTLDTATPTAQAQSLPIVKYDSQELEALALKLRARGGSVLVVGHSNTTPELAGLLMKGKKNDEMDESIYDRIYQVILSDSGNRLQILHQTFSCQPELR